MNNKKKAVSRKTNLNFYFFGVGEMNDAVLRLAGEDGMLKNSLKACLHAY